MNMADLMMTGLKVWQEGYLLQEDDGKAYDRDRHGCKIVILLKFVTVEMLEILLVKQFLKTIAGN